MAALNKLIPLVHQEFNWMAHNYVSKEQTGHTLQTAALVRKAYLHLGDSSQMHWKNRDHFLCRPGVERSFETQLERHEVR